MSTVNAKCNFRNEAWLLQEKHTEFLVHIMYHNQTTESSLLETICRDMENVYKKLWSCYVQVEFYLYCR